MKILHFVNTSQRWSGVEQYTYDVAKGAVQRGHEVIFAVSNDGDKTNRYSDLGRVFKLNMRHKTNIATTIKLRRLIKTETPDIIHTHTLRGANQAQLAMICLPKIPTINTLHLFSVANSYALYKKTLSKTTTIIAVSEAVRQDYIKHFHIADEQKIIAILNSIDSSRIATGQNHKPSNVPVVGCAARVVPDKGVHILLEAAKILNDKGLKFKIVIAGTGNEHYQAALQKYTYEHHLDDIVEWQGFRSDIDNFISSIDIGILPSVWREPCGLSIIEQMSAGKPVISTDSGGQCEMIRNGRDGLIIPANDAQAMAEALEKLISNPELTKQMGCSAKEHFLTELNFDIFIDKTLQAYNVAMNR